MWLGFGAAVLAFAPHNLQTLGLLVVSGLATGLLIIDDRWSMRPFAKLAVQVGLALLAVVGFYLHNRLLRLPRGPNNPISPPLPVGVGVVLLGRTPENGHL